MKYVPNWQEDDKKCKLCGIKKSVKWEHDGLRFCNKCIGIVIKEMIKRDKIE